MDMKFLEITTNIGCVNRCSYCPQNELMEAYNTRSNETLMSYEKFVSYLEKVPRNVTIIFSGFSEPFLNRDALKMMRYAHEKKHRAYLNTTLVGLTETDIEELRKIPFQFICIHLPSVDERFINLERYRELLSLVCKEPLCIPKYHVTFVHEGEIDESLRFIITKYGYALNKMKIISRGSTVKGMTVSYKKAPLMCGRMYANILLPNGDVLLCCMDWKMRHILGNLENDTYKDIQKEIGDIKIRCIAGEDTLCNVCEMSYFPISIRSVRNVYMNVLRMVNIGHRVAMIKGFLKELYKDQTE